jgi:hypothetical protein
MHAPSYPVTDGRREYQCRKEADTFARQAVLSFVQMGWRETEAALALADSMDDYCLYLSITQDRRHAAANSNSRQYKSPEAMR